MSPGIPRIAITPGEPAGIGPDLALAVAGQAWSAEIVAIADMDLLRERATLLGRNVLIREFREGDEARSSAAGELLVRDVPLASPVRAGTLDPANARYVLATLEEACEGCRAGRFAAMVTGPVHKGVINDAGVAFSGHTEYLAARTGARRPVMLLVAGALRVALVTTHLALRDVPDSITGPDLENVIRILHAELRQLFSIRAPRIMVLGVNPHAGESGHLGREEQETIIPVLRRLRREGLDLLGPAPADTAFIPEQLARCDAVLAMYHDQGLPVLKHRGFGQAVNVTLGLPILRTSVDHGTALDLAATGKADSGSVQAALDLAIGLSGRRPG